MSMTTDTKRAELIAALRALAREVYSPGRGGLLIRAADYIEQHPPAPDSPCPGCECCAACFEKAIDQIGYVPAPGVGVGEAVAVALIRKLGFDGIEALPGYPTNYDRSSCSLETMLGDGSLLADFYGYVGHEAHPSPVDAAVERDAWNTDFSQLPADTCAVMESADGRLWVGHFNSARGQIYGPYKPVRWCAIPERKALTAQQESGS